MTIEDDIAFLERVPTLHLLSRQALRILAIGAQSRYVHGGEILFNAGCTCDFDFHFVDGAFLLIDGIPLHIDRTCTQKEHERGEDSE